MPIWHTCAVRDRGWRISYRAPLSERVQVRRSGRPGTCDEFRGPISGRRRAGAGGRASTTHTRTRTSTRVHQLHAGRDEEDDTPPRPGVAAAGASTPLLRSIGARVRTHGLWRYTWRALLWRFRRRRAAAQRLLLLPGPAAYSRRRRRRAAGSIRARSPTCTWRSMRTRSAVERGRRRCRRRWPLLEAVSRGARRDRGSGSAADSSSKRNDKEGGSSNGRIESRRRRRRGLHCAA